MVAIHPQIRIIRMAMVLVIFVLTVFLYASYYASPGLASMPNRIHFSSDDAQAELDAQPLLVMADSNDIQQPIAADEALRIRNAAAHAYEQAAADAAVRSPSVVQSEPDNVNTSNAAQPSFPADVSIPSGAAVDSAAAGESQSRASSTKALLLPSAAAAAAAAASTTLKANATAPSSAAAPEAPAVPAVAAAATAPQRPAPAAVVADHSHGGGKSDIDTLKGVRTSAIYEPGHSEAAITLCPDGGESMRLMILITSAPTHHDARLSIRQTWGSYATRRDIGIGFILGSTQSAAVEDTLAAENYMYGDLIRGHFLDSYNNLTLKTISSLEWIDQYCPKVPFFLKTDDDMFINIPKLMAFMEKHHNDRNIIYGRLANKWKPIRNSKSKYYVSPQQYFPPVFPSFTTGPAYLMSTDVVHDLYAKALNQTYLKLEDVFTTGIVAQLVNVKRVHVNEFLNRRIAFNPCNIRRLISVHMVKSNEQFDLWKKLLDTSTKCK